MVKAFSDFRNIVVLGVEGSTPSAHHIFFQMECIFSLLLIMCMLFTIKVISILIKSFLSVTIVLIPGFAARLLVRSMFAQEY